jgi:heme oxygenase
LVSSSPATPFSTELRTATTQAHEAAESSTFVPALLEGRLSARAFTDLAVQQWVVYGALERAFAGCRHPALHPFLDPRLVRVPALEADLAHLVGEGWQQQLGAGVPVVPSATAYADAVAEHADDATFLLAHHYVRYLGDLSGGQVIARLVQREYGIGDEGLHFYDFSSLGKPKAYKDAYRVRLDEVALTGAERGAVVEHAQAAFESSRRIFVDLAALHLAVPVA